ncbi:hypothetical protein [Blautia massiliensis (ex Liu et al. 2021)]|uniref:hypothetical protein n=1 Tax=Blautia massiliensis (ex Liu et al. 2021) TaxID=3062492 RepID=UPI003F8989E4
MKHAYIYYYTCIGMSRCFSQKFQKNMQKIPDAVWKRGNDTYLWEKGEIIKGKTPEKLQAAAKKSLQSYRKRG